VFPGVKVRERGGDGENGARLETGLNTTQEVPNPHWRKKNIIKNNGHKKQIESSGKMIDNDTEKGGLNDHGPGSKLSPESQGTTH